MSAPPRACGSDRATDPTAAGGRISTALSAATARHLNAQAKRNQPRSLATPFAGAVLHMHRDDVDCSIGHDELTPADRRSDRHNHEGTLLRRGNDRRERPGRRRVRDASKAALAGACLNRLRYRID